jgi:hypothetical protein
MSLMWRIECFGYVTQQPQSPVVTHICHGTRARIQLPAADYFIMKTLPRS